MDDSEYWTSLWVLGLIIFFCLFCLYLGAAVLGFFADRISTYEIWKSPSWLKLKIPFIVLGVIGFIAAAITFSSYQEQKELKGAQDHAQAQGWGFSREAEEGFKVKVAAILSDLKFDLYYIRTVETGQRDLYLFDCSYNNREASARSNHNSYGTASLVLSKRFRDVVAPLEIITRDWTEIMQSDKVEIGETPFARKFLVLSKDPGSAKRIINESIQAIFLENISNPRYYPTSVTIGPGGAVVLTGRTAEPERLQDLLEFARKLESTGK